MIRRLPDSSEARVGGGDVRKLYVDSFTNREMTLQFAKSVLERSPRKLEDCFVLTSLEAQNRVLDAACPGRSPGDVDAVVGDDVVSAVLDVDKDWNLGGAIVLDDVDRRAVE